MQSILNKEKQPKGRRCKALTTNLRYLINHAIRIKIVK